LDLPFRRPPKHPPHTKGGRRTREKEDASLSPVGSAGSSEEDLDFFYSIGSLACRCRAGLSSPSGELIEHLFFARVPSISSCLLRALITPVPRGVEIRADAKFQLGNLPPLPLENLPSPLNRAYLSADSRRFCRGLVDDYAPGVLLEIERALLKHVGT